MFFWKTGDGRVSIFSHLFSLVNPLTAFLLGTAYEKIRSSPWKPLNHRELLPYHCLSKSGSAIDFIFTSEKKQYLI